MIDAIRELKEQGYRISLDDFEYSPALEPLLRSRTSSSSTTWRLAPSALPAEVELLKPYPVSVLAEKIETKEEHQYCMALGCDLFQGFFYQEPELIRRRGSRSAPARCCR